MEAATKRVMGNTFAGKARPQNVSVTHNCILRVQKKDEHRLPQKTDVLSIRTGKVFGGSLD